MRLTHFTLHNWRNFKEADFDLQDRMLVVGPNASGKSNLLDALRFLREVASAGGGFQQAVANRGGLPRIRCLAARNHNRGRVTMRIALGGTIASPEWEGQSMNAIRTTTPVGFRTGRAPPQLITIIRY